MARSIFCNHYHSTVHTALNMSSHLQGKTENKYVKSVHDKKFSLCASLCRAKYCNVTSLCELISLVYKIHKPSVIGWLMYVQNILCPSLVGTLNVVIVYNAYSIIWPWSIALNTEWSLFFITLLMCASNCIAWLRAVHLGDVVDRLQSTSSFHWHVVDWRGHVVSKNSCRQRKIGILYYVLYWRFW